MHHHAIRLLTLFAFLALVPMTADAGSWVTYQSGSDTVRAYLAMPEGEGPHPALIVFHEWWGLADWIKQSSDGLAKQGYLALAVDLYRGELATNPEDARKLAQSLPQDRALMDIKAADRYLRSRPDVKKDRIGSIGWCMGGTYSGVALTTLPRLAAGVVCYGRVPTTQAEAKKVVAPVLGIFGGRDRAYPADTAKAFEKAAKAQKKSVEVVVYPEASHAFMNPTNTQGYRKDDAEDAWSRIYAFLDRRLKK